MTPIRLGLLLSGIILIIVVIIFVVNQLFNFTLINANGAAVYDADDPNDVCNSEIQGVEQAIGAFYFGEVYFEGKSEYSREYNLECARLAYKRAIEIDPKGFYRTWYQFGRIDFLEGKFSSAIYKFDKQIEFFGDDVESVHYMLGLSYGYRARANQSDDDWKKAEEAFRLYLELDPASPWARTDLAWILFSQGKYEDMKPILKEGLRLVPAHPWLLNMYGLALLNTEERERAQKYFANALKEAEKLTVADWGGAYPGNDPGNWPKGLSEMKKAIQRNIEISK